jgi:hypothetical protein
MLANALTVISRGELGPSTQSYSEGMTMPNYIVSALDDASIAAVVQMNDTSDTVWFVGADVVSPTNLCADPHTCPAAGPHACTGLLANLANAGDPHVVLFVCRTLVGSEPVWDRRLMVDDDGASSSAVVDQLDAIAEQFLSYDEPRRLAAWDAFDEDTRVLLVSHKWSIRNWSDALGAKYLLKTEGLGAFETYVATLSADVQELVRNDPDVQRLRWARDAATAILTRDAEEMGTWFDSLSATDRELLLADPDVGRWLTQRTAQHSATPPISSA